MNTVKHIITFLFILSSFFINAQSNRPLINAFKLSYEYEGLKNYEAAINALNSSYIETSYEINLRMGWLNYLTGKHKESILYYQKASALMPVSTEVLWGLINPYSKLEDWNNVEKVYLSILKIDPKNSKANHQLGMIYYYRKEYKEAKKYFDVTLNLAPFDYNNLLMSSWTNYFLGNKNEAIILFNKVLLYSPHDKSALEGLNLIK